MRVYIYIYIVTGVYIYTLTQPCQCTSTHGFFWNPCQLSMAKSPVTCQQPWPDSYHEFRDTLLTKYLPSMTGTYQISFLLEDGRGRWREPRNCTRGIKGSCINIASDQPYTHPAMPLHFHARLFLKPVPTVYGKVTGNVPTAMARQLSRISWHTSYEVSAIHDWHLPNLIPRVPSWLTVRNHAQRCRVRGGWEICARDCKPWSMYSLAVGKCCQCDKHI